MHFKRIPIKVKINDIEMYLVVFKGIRMGKKYDSRPEIIEAEINGAVTDFDGGAYTVSHISSFKNCSDDDELRKFTSSILAMINASETNNNIYVKGEEEFFFPTLIKTGDELSSYFNQIKDKHWAKLDKVLNKEVR